MTLKREREKKKATTSDSSVGGSKKSSIKFATKSIERKMKH